MNEKVATDILNKIIEQVFGTSNSLSLAQFAEKFTFDLRLPHKVQDITDGSVTWANSINPTKFVKQSNALNNEAQAHDGLYASQPIKDLHDLLGKWEHINLTTAEHAIDSINIAESDLITHSENIFHSSDTHYSKNIIYSDGITDSEFMAACSRSIQSSFCIRADDSVKCSNSFGVTRSINLTNCIMIHDCADMQDSMFCTNMKGRRFCIANMQFDEAEYRRLHKQVVQWILSPSS